METAVPLEQVAVLVELHTTPHSATVQLVEHVARHLTGVVVVAAAQLLPVQPQ
jgi:hypothetical protein